MAKKQEPVKQLGNCIVCGNPIMIHFRSEKDELGKSEMYNSDNQGHALHLKCAEGHPVTEVVAIVKQSLKMYELVTYIHQGLSDKKTYRSLAIHEQTYLEETTKILEAISPKDKNEG